ncbi:glycosyltransferase family A protein [Synechococcus sp. CBW1107]|uniref:glycosyltransferase family A protein n=1 Tax=Synechococcus sp. CBW1107 TaxID=2789857 RepID=UPI001E2F104E|nr:glycosyltransferase family A protein [Synechococcus sp. CBW1107]
MDWGSQIPIDRHSLPADPRVRLLRVEGEAEWQLTRAYNFAISQSSFETILKLDADCWIDDLEYNPLPLQQRSYCRTIGGGGLNGVFMITRSNFFSVGGFNEYLKGYGYDDKDLFLRLDQLMVGTAIPKGIFCTIDHGDLERVSADTIQTVGERSCKPHSNVGTLLELIARMEETKAINRYLAERLEWSIDSPSTIYRLLGRNQWQAEKGSIPVPSAEVQHEARVLGNRIYLSILLGVHERLLDMMIPASSLQQIRNWMPLSKGIAWVRISTLFFGIRVALWIKKVLMRM